jgi:hypothetical protein
MPACLKDYLISQNTKQGKSPTKLFRILVNGVIEDKDGLIFSTRNREKMIQDYPIVLACKGKNDMLIIIWKINYFCLDFIYQLTKKFDFKDFDDTLRYMCTEARRSLNQHNKNQLINSQVLNAEENNDNHLQIENSVETPSNNYLDSNSALEHSENSNSNTRTYSQSSNSNNFNFFNYDDSDRVIFV